MIQEITVFNNSELGLLLKYMTISLEKYKRGKSVNVLVNYNLEFFTKFSFQLLLKGWQLHRLYQ